MHKNTLSKTQCISKSTDTQNANDRFVTQIIKGLKDAEDGLRIKSQTAFYNEFKLPLEKQLYAKFNNENKDNAYELADLIEDAFIQAFNRIKTYRIPDSFVKQNTIKWLSKIAYHLMLERQRNQFAIVHYDNTNYENIITHQISKQIFELQEFNKSTQGRLDALRDYLLKLPKSHLEIILTYALENCLKGDSRLSKSTILELVKNTGLQPNHIRVIKSRIRKYIEKHFAQ